MELLPLVLVAFVVTVLGALAYVLWVVWDERPPTWPEQMMTAATVAGVVLIMGGFALVRALGPVVIGGSPD